jgi:hypothetical protein
MAKQCSVPIGIKQECPASLEGEAVQAGKSRRRGWFHWFKVGTKPQRGRPGRYAIVEKLMKRVGFGDWYSEKVRDKDSGEVIHERHEPLSEHQRHGSAKHVVPN